MRVLTMTSFYSGLRQSVLSNQWQPAGMPAFYQLLEGFKKHNVHFDSILFYSAKQDLVKAHKIDHFPEATFKVIAYSTTRSRWRLTDQKRHFNKIMSSVNDHVALDSYDLIYIDREQVGLVPFLKASFHGKIVVRLHGIGTMYQNFQKSLKYRLLNHWRKRAFRTQVDLLISSRDGTPVPDFIKSFVHKKTPVSILLNGVSQAGQKESGPQNLTEFLLIGRLELDKGSLDIVNAFADLSAELKQRCRLHVVGNGSLAKMVEGIAQREQHITYHGEQKHEEVKRFYESCHVCISINYLGNIANVVLEALAHELMIITLKPEAGFDEESHKFLQNNACYVSRARVKEDLSLLIPDLLGNPGMVRDYQLRVRNELKPQISSWEQRIEQEIDMLRELTKA